MRTTAFLVKGYYLIVFKHRVRTFPDQSVDQHFAGRGLCGVFVWISQVAQGLFSAAPEEAFRSAYVVKDERRTSSPPSPRLNLFL